MTIAQTRAARRRMGNDPRYKKRASRHQRADMLAAASRREARKRQKSLEMAQRSKKK